MGAANARVAQRGFPPRSIATLVPGANAPHRKPKPHGRSVPRSWDCALWDTAGWPNTANPLTSPQHAITTPLRRCAPPIVVE
jgi:hypothetical protein